MFFLKANRSFDATAEQLLQIFNLTDVAACIFPSRPEPRSANFRVGETVVMTYTYLPDIELRFLTPNDDVTSARVEKLLFNDLDSVAALTDQLSTESFVAVGRAAKAIALMTPNQPELGDVLLNAALGHSDEAFRNAILLHFASSAQPQQKSTIHSALQSTNSTETRLYLHQAIQAIALEENRRFARR